MQTYGPVRRCVVAGWYVRLPCPREWATGRSAALPPRIHRGARFRGARARVRVRVRERESVPASPARRAATQRAATGIVGVAGGVGARARAAAAAAPGWAGSRGTAPAGHARSAVASRVAGAVQWRAADTVLCEIIAVCKVCLPD